MLVSSFASFFLFFLFSNNDKTENFLIFLFFLPTFLVLFSCIFFGSFLSVSARRELMAREEESTSY